MISLQREFLTHVILHYAEKTTAKLGLFPSFWCTVHNVIACRKIATYTLYSSIYGTYGSIHLFLEYSVVSYGDGYQELG